MKRPRSLHETSLTIEPLEPRQMLDGIPGWDDVPPLRQDITKAIAAVLKGEGDHALDIGQLDMLPDYLAETDSLTPLFEASGLFLREQGELKVAEARTGFLQSHIAEEGQAITRLQTTILSNRTALQETLAALEQCSIAESALIAEVQRSAAHIAALQSEQQPLPGQIDAAQKQVDDNQALLGKVRRVRELTEASISSLQQRYAKTLREHDTWHALAERRPRVTQYQKQHAQLHTLLATLEQAIKRYQKTLTGYRSHEARVATALESGRQTLERLRARHAALPGEITAAQEDLASDQAALATNGAEQARLAQEITDRQSSIDAAVTEEQTATAHLALDESELTSLLAQEHIEENDVAQIHAVVNEAIAQVLAEGDPPIPETEEEEPEPVLLTDAVTMASGTTESNVWTAELANMGGSVKIQTWQGHANFTPSIGSVTGAALRRALIETGITTETVNAQQSLAAALGFQTGLQPAEISGYLIDATRETATMGRVSVIADTYADRRVSSPPLRYLFCTQGCITSGNVTDDRGTLRIDHIGENRVDVRFDDGPHYVQWVNVALLGGTGGMTLITLREDGTQYCFSTSGGAVIVDDVITGFAVVPSNSQTFCGIRSVNTDPLHVLESGDDHWIKTGGELVGIDVAQAGTAVGSVDLRLHTVQTGNTVRAIAYRAETRLSEQAIGADGIVHCEDPAGITSVLLVQSNPNAPLYVAGMTVAGTAGSVPPAAAGLTPMSNRDVGEWSTRQWEHGAFNWAQIADNNGVLRNRGGYANRVSGSVLFHTGICENSQTQYSRYDIYSISGNASIAALLYIDSDGLHPVPGAYWQAAAGNCFITAPGGPKYLVLRISGNGTFDVGVSVADSATDVMPSQEMDLRSSVLVVRRVGPAEGFCAVPPGVSTDNEHAQAGGTVNMFYQILNDGLGGGPITARIHVGQTGSAEDPVIREFTGTLAGLQSIGLSVNVTLQNDNDNATMEVIGPNGQSTLVSKRVRPPHGDSEEMPFGSISAYCAQDRLERLGVRNAEILASSNDPRVRALWIARTTPNPQDRRLIANAAAQNAEETEETVEEGEELADATDTLAWDVMVGGIVVQNRETPLCSDADWFDETGYIVPGVRTDTAMSRHFLGLVQRLALHANHVAADPNGEAAKGIVFDPDFASHLYPALLETERMTGIPWMKIAKAADLGFCSGIGANALRDRMADGLQQLFIQAQYGEIGDTGRQLNASEVVGVHAGRPSYTDADRAVRLRFDFKSPDMRYDRGNVYLLDANGNQIGGERAALVSGYFRNTAYIDVPMQRILDVLGQCYSGTLRLKVALWDEAGDTAGIQGRFTSEPFTLEVKGGLTFSPQDILGEAAWNEVVAAGDQDLVRGALDFDNVGPEKNRQLITWLVDHYLDTASTEEHRMNYQTDQHKWIAGTPYEDPDNVGYGECKYWVQMDVVKNALGITLPSNSTKENASTWASSAVVQQLATEADGDIQQVIKNNVSTAQAGDMIQMATSNGSKMNHTVIIGKIEMDGIWVFDSNYESPNTPTYRKMSFTQLSNYDLFSIYRLT